MILQMLSQKCFVGVYHLLIAITEGHYRCDFEGIFDNPTVSFFGE